VEIFRSDSSIRLDIDDNGKMLLMKAQFSEPFKPRLDPKSNSPLKMVVYRKGISDVFKTFNSIVKQIK